MHQTIVFLVLFEKQKKHKYNLISCNIHLLSYVHERQFPFLFLIWYRVMLNISWNIMLMLFLRLGFFVQDLACTQQIKISTRPSHTHPFFINNEDFQENVGSSFINSALKARRLLLKSKQNQVSVNQDKKFHSKIDFFSHHHLSLTEYLAHEVKHAPNTSILSKYTVLSSLYWVKNSSLD